MIIMGDKKKALTAILGPDSPAVGYKGDGMGPEKPEGESEPLHEVAKELIECFHNKDVEGVIEGLRAIFESFDAEPHSEGEHV